MAECDRWLDRFDALEAAFEEQLLFGFSKVLLLGVQRRKMDQHTPLMKVFF